MSFLRRFDAAAVLAVVAVAILVCAWSVAVGGCGSNCKSTFRNTCTNDEPGDDG